ncbi:MAG: serine/threonine-protein kinase [Deltaproteobacteria bacterium]|nr:serine/threonine-protein kinase [Deltaproteobacteria bacterium]
MSTRGSQMHPHDSLIPGAVVLGKYVLIRLLGLGGMGHVFLAQSMRSGGTVAVKVLSDGASIEHAERFRREGALMSRVHHPNVVEILDYGLLDDQSPCIVMEYVDGAPLSDRLDQSRAMAWQDAVRIILGVLDGLEAVHDAGILHRDLKPSNVALTKGPPEVVKLLDFGIARTTEPSPKDRRVTRTGNIVGSLDYMSPEALVNEPLDERTDIYSAGMMLYEMLVGAFPFADEPMAAAFRRLSADVPAPVAPGALPVIPDELAKISLSALARDRNLRPRSASELSQPLRELLKPKRIAREIPRAAVIEPTAKPLPTGPSALKTTPPQSPALPPTARSVASVSGSIARPQFVVLAQLPLGTLAKLDERLWLAELVRNGGRGYALGEDRWCAVLVATDSILAERHSLMLLDALEHRYPKVRVAGGTVFDPHFSLASNVGTSKDPMPEPLPSLLAQLAAMRT